MCCCSFLRLTHTGIKDIPAQHPVPITGILCAVLSYRNTGCPYNLVIKRTERTRPATFRWGKCVPALYKTVFCTIPDRVAIWLRIPPTGIVNAGPTQKLIRVVAARSPQLWHIDPANSHWGGCTCIPKRPQNSSSYPEKTNKLCRKTFLLTRHEHKIGLWMFRITLNEKINGFFCRYNYKLWCHEHLITFHERING